MFHGTSGVSKLAATLFCSLILLFSIHFLPAAADQTSATQSGAAGQSGENASGTSELEKLSVHLKVGWINMPPFQHPVAGELSEVEGLDVDILTKIANALKIQVELTERSWRDQLERLEEGKSDLAMGAFKPENGDDRFYYSLPYRKARVTFLVRHEDRKRYVGNDPASLILRETGFRVGYIPARLFPQQPINEALAAAEAQGRAIAVETDEENLRNLLAGHIDGFFSDRLSIGAIELEDNLKFAASAIFLSEPVDVHFLLSKKAVSPKALDRLNAEITKLDDAGELKRLLHATIFSVIIGYLFESLFFKCVVILAIATATLSGLMLAYKESYSVTGMLLLGAITALGGGLLRDVILDRRPSLLSNPIYLETVVVTALLAFAVLIASRHIMNPQRATLLAKRLPKWLSFDMMQEIFDAAGLAAFTVVGVAVAIATDIHPLWLWGPICGMLTGAGGGIARDIIRQKGSVATLRSEFYVEVPLFWGLALSVFLLSRPMMLEPREVATAIIGTGAAAFITRMTAVYIRMRANSREEVAASPSSTKEQET